MKIRKQTLIEHQDQLREKFGPNTPIAYYNVSESQLSIARYSGGATINGHFYFYIPPDDMLLRDDVIKFLAKLQKEIKAKEPNPPDSPKLPFLGA